MFLLFKSYWDIEKLCTKGLISRKDADEIHKHQKSVSEARNESEQASRKMVAAHNAIEKIGNKY